MIIAAIIIVFIFVALNIPLTMSFVSEKKTLCLTYGGAFKLIYRFQDKSSVRIHYPGRRILNWFVRQKRPPLSSKHNVHRDVKDGRAKKKQSGGGAKTALFFFIKHRKRLKHIFGRSFMGWLIKRLIGRFGLIGIRYVRLHYSHPNPLVLGMIAGVSHNISFPRTVTVNPNFFGKNSLEISIHTTPMKIMYFIVAMVLYALLKLKSLKSSHT